MSQVLAVNMDPGMASQMIRGNPNIPMGAPVAGAAPTTPSRGVINPQASRVYDRMFQQQDDKRDRRELLEDKARIRQQQLDDDVRDRNRKIDDLDRTRIEELADDQRDYDRKGYDRQVQRRKDTLYFKELERQRQETNRKLRDEKSDQLLKAETAYGALLDLEAGSENLAEVRQRINETRQGLARERQINKEQLASAVLVDFQQIIAGPGLSGEEEELVDKIVQQVTGDSSKDWEDVAGLDDELKLAIGNQLISYGKGQGFGELRGKINARLERHGEIQSKLNEQIAEYDKMSKDISSKESSPEAMARLKAAYKKRIVELGGKVDQFKPRPSEGEENNADTSKVANADTSKAAEGETVGDKDFNEFANKSKKEGELENDVDRKRIALQEAKDDSVQSVALDTAEAIGDAAQFTADGLSQLDSDDVITGASIVAPTAIALNEARKNKNKLTDAKIKRRENSLKRINEKIKTQGYFTQAKDINTFLENHKMKPFNEPMPDGKLSTLDNLRKRYEYEQKLADHMDSELKVKNDTFAQKLKKKMSSKGAQAKVKTAGLALAVYEAIVLGKAIGQELGWLKKDPEVVAAARELAEAQKAVLEFKQASLQQAKETVQALKDAKSGEAEDSEPSLEEAFSQPVE